MTGRELLSKLHKINPSHTHTYGSQHNHRDGAAWHIENDVPIEVPYTGCGDYVGSLVQKSNRLEFMENDSWHGFLSEWGLGYGYVSVVVRPCDLALDEDRDDYGDFFETVCSLDKYPLLNDERHSLLKTDATYECLRRDTVPEVRGALKDIITWYEEEEGGSKYLPVLNMLYENDGHFFGEGSTFFDRLVKHVFQEGLAENEVGNDMYVPFDKIAMCGNGVRTRTDLIEFLHGVLGDFIVTKSGLCDAHVGWHWHRFSYASATYDEYGTLTMKCVKCGGTYTYVLVSHWRDELKWLDLCPVNIGICPQDDLPGIEKWGLV